MVPDPAASLRRTSPSPRFCLGQVFHRAGGLDAAIRSFEALALQLPGTRRSPPPQDSQTRLIETYLPARK
jgi:hypothetical protein